MLLVVMLFLTAQSCDACGDDDYLPDYTPSRTGAEVTIDLSANPAISPVREPVALTYTLTLAPITSRTTISSTLDIALPAGVELIQPVQLRFTTSLTNCTLLSATADSLLLTASGPLCSFSIDVQAVVPGNFTISTTLALNETQTGYINATYYYPADVTLRTTGGIIVRKSFTPAEVKQGETSTMTITLSNDSPIAVSGIRFNDPMPAGMTLLGITSNSCADSRITVRGDRFDFERGSLAANGFCTITASVRGDSGGLLTNTTSFISAVEFNYSNQGQASLKVLLPTSTPLPPPPPPPPPEEPRRPVCGNMICEVGENLENCVLDCG
jgi:uncharacterized repeat protein (TIGR01451 family)